MQGRLQPHAVQAATPRVPEAGFRPSVASLQVLLLVGFAAVRVAAFTLIYHGLLGIGVSLDNPIGDDPADLPGLAFQVCVCIDRLYVPGLACQTLVLTALYPPYSPYSLTPPPPHHPVPGLHAA